MTEAVTTIDLLRHGECRGGAIFRGRTDSPLSIAGRQQMQQATHAGHWQQLISSPRQRCQQFAEQLAEVKQLPLDIVVDFQEIDFGDWDGRPIKDIKREAPTQLTAPNGESLLHFQQRVQRGWKNLLSRHRGQHCLLISHGGVIRILLAQVLGIDLDGLHSLSVPYACRSQIKIFHHPDHPDWTQLMSHKPL